MTRFPSLLLLLAAAMSWPAGAQIAPPNELGVAMGHVHLNVKDIETQRTFWTTYFGAEPLKRSGLTGVKVPGMLILFRQQAYTRGAEGTSMDHFGFKVPSTSKLVARLREAGYKIEREFKGTEGFPNAYVIGPDEVKIELQEDASMTAPALAYHLHFMNASGDQIKLRDWYAKNFGAVVKKRGQHDAADIPGMNLTFGIAREAPSAGTKGTSTDHIGFEVKNLEAFCKRLEVNGVKLDVPYRKIPAAGIAIAFLTDPFGTYVELTEGLDQY
ncbi:MAG TPA: VOC family protein [Bryobacteraceae bacterium]|jgi:catechol 2,3-dioxygenase-like lactoylglutathione lyase family enzyme|nr:VOC family protein [Bryobacteraceae bacterium]